MGLLFLLSLRVFIVARRMFQTTVKNSYHIEKIYESY